jgi:hypothetical protein
MGNRRIHAMKCDAITPYRIRLDPVGTAPHLDVGVRVDGPDLPGVGGDFIATIFLDRVVHSLSELFGLDKDRVDRIREQLEAGSPVHIEVQAMHTQLVQANFIQG